MEQQQSVGEISPDEILRPEAHRRVSNDARQVEGRRQEPIPAGRNARGTGAS